MTLEQYLEKIPYGKEYIVTIKSISHPTLENTISLDDLCAYSYINMDDLKIVNKEIYLNHLYIIIE